MPREVIRKEIHEGVRIAHLFVRFQPRLRTDLASFRPSIDASPQDRGRVLGRINDRHNEHGPPRIAWPSGCPIGDRQFWQLNDSARMFRPSPSSARTDIGRSDRAPRDEGSMKTVAIPQWRYHQATAGGLGAVNDNFCTCQSYR
jgi:hypothetical protein